MKNKVTSILFFILQEQDVIEKGDQYNNNGHACMAKTSLVVQEPHLYTFQPQYLVFKCCSDQEL